MSLAGRAGVERNDAIHTQIPSGPNQLDLLPARCIEPDFEPFPGL